MNAGTSMDLSTFQRGAGLRDYISVLVRRKWLILVSFFSLIGATAYYLYTAQDIYEAYSTLVIEEQSDLINQAMNMGTGRSLSFYEGILNSRTFLEVLLDSIGIDVFHETFPKMSRDAALNYIQTNISLRRTSYTSFLRFNVQAATRELSYLMASIGTAVFRAQCREVSSEETRRTVLEIDKQLALMRKKLETAEHDYRTFKERTGDLSDGTTPELKTLQTAYATQLAQLGLKEADLNAGRKQLAQLEERLTPPEHTRSAEFLKLRSKLRELEQERMRLEGLGILFTSSSAIDREISEIEKQLLQYKQPTGTIGIDTRLIRQWQELRKTVLNSEADLELSRSRLKSYKEAIDQYRKGNPNILVQSLELQRLERTREIYEKIYNFLLNKAEEERIKSAASGGGIKIVDPARMPDNPLPKKSMRFYLLGGILGMVIGLGLAFLVDFNDTTIRSTDDIERYLGLAVLGTIPHITMSRKNEIAIRRTSSRKGKGKSVLQYPRQLLNFSGDESVIAEAYRSLRTNLSFVSPDHPVQTVLVTSAGPSEGKSLTITNLAIAHAQMGRRTLLIDTDLRRPILHHLFEVRREPGLADLFTDGCEYDKVIRPTPRENLFLITAGLFTPNPAELIGSQKMTGHIEYFRKNFDIIFFDTPPVVAVTDASLLSTKVDGVLLVVKSHHIVREVAARAIQNLRTVGAKIIGIVLNDIDITHRYSSYGYYKYYYHYHRTKAD